MKKVIFILLIAFQFINSRAQTIVFERYEDYETGRGAIMDEEYFLNRQGSFGTKLFFKTQGGEEKKYRPINIWGFYYKGHLFRSVGNEIGMLVDTGKVFYFLNGFASIYLLKHPGSSNGYYFPGQSKCYLSVGKMNGKLYKMPVGIDKRDLKDFIEDYPEFKSLNECLSDRMNTYEYQRTQECVKKFNEMEKE